MEGVFPVSSCPALTSHLSSHVRYLLAGSFFFSNFQSCTHGRLPARFCSHFHPSVFLFWTLIKTRVHLRTVKGKFGMVDGSLAVPAERRESCGQRDGTVAGWMKRKEGKPANSFLFSFCSLSLFPLCYLGPSAWIDSVFWVTVLTGKAVLFYGCSRMFGPDQPGSRDPRTACSIRRAGRGRTQPLPEKGL